MASNPTFSNLGIGNMLKISSFLLLLLLLFTTVEAVEIPTLKTDSPQQQTLTPEQSHFYNLPLNKGEFVQIRLLQQGVESAMLLFDQNEKKLLSADYPISLIGQKDLFFIAEESGRYKIEVKAVRQGVIGKYKLELLEYRQSTPEDQKLIAAQKAFADATNLRKENRKDAIAKSVQTYQEAANLWQQAKNYYWYANSLYSAAQGELVLARVDQAMNLHQQALKVRLEIKDRRGEGDSIHAIAQLEVFYSKFNEALPKLNQALILRREIGDTVGEIQTLQVLGTSYSELGNKKKGSEYFEQVLKLASSIDEKSAQSAALNGLGINFWAMSELEKALEYLEQSLKLKKEVGDKRGEGTTLNNIGIIHSTLKNYTTALDYQTRALAIRVELGDKRGEGNTLSNIASLYLYQENYKTALDYLEKVLQGKKEIKDRKGEATALNVITGAYIKMGDYKKALGYANQSLQLMREIGERHGESYCLNHLGHIYKNLGETNRAVSFYQQALEILKEVGDRVKQADLLGQIAEFEYEVGDVIKARKTIEEAISIAENIRANVRSQELRTSSLERLKHLYEIYIRILMSQSKSSKNLSKQYIQEAFEASERARARTLLELLKESNIKLRQGIDPQLLSRELELNQNLSSTAEKLFAAKNPSRNREEKEEIEKLETEVALLNEELDKLNAEIKLTSPKYAAITQPVPLKLQDIQTKILDSQTVLLEYSLGDETSYLWVITDHSISSYQLPDAETIEALAKQLYKHLSSRNSNNLESLVVAKKLSKILLQPAASMLANRRIVVVADGFLQNIPFGALIDPRSTKQNLPLMFRNEVINLPSASTLAVLRSETEARKKADKTIVVLADPVFDVQDTRVQQLLTKKQDKKSIVEEPVNLLTMPADTRNLTFVNKDSRLYVPRLPGTRLEAEKILSLLPNEEKRAVFDFDVNRSVVLEDKLSNYQIVHFATHALVDTERPELSGLILSLIDEEGEKRNGLLLLSDLFNLNLPAELVVLSACQTGLGKEARGEGIVGLTRGFMYAGAKRVVVSLWAVDDLATAEMMGSFYEKLLKQGQTPAQALRNAQISIWKQQKWRAPYYWAAFQLQGEWRN